MGSWSQLSLDLLAQIAQRVPSVQDYISFRGVCTLWRSAATTQNFVRSKSNRVPLLMLAEEGGCNVRKFFSLTEGVIKGVMLPEASKKHCLSSRGWLLAVAEDNVHVNLLHPFSGVQIELPNLPAIRSYTTDIRKMVLSSSPYSKPDFVIVVIWGPNGDLGFCRPRDAVWTGIKTRVDDTPILDITFHNGQLYVVHAIGKVVVFDNHTGLSQTTPRWVVSVLPREYICMPIGRIKELYLVESPETLLVVWQLGIYPDLDEDLYETRKFLVFELSLSDGKLIRVDNLGDKALFLGYNSSISVEAAPNFNGCKPKRIYFTDDCFSCKYLLQNGAFKDEGIYNILDGSFEPHFRGISCSSVTPPTWVEPTFGTY